MWVSRKKKVQTVSKAMVSVTVVKGLTLKACNYVNTDLPI